MKLVNTMKTVTVDKRNDAFLSSLAIAAVDKQPASPYCRYSAAKAQLAELVTHLHSSCWHSETDCNIAVLISKD